MMGAVQPFISGAISKTVNLPASATVEDIADAYTQAWHLGVKALAIYRDGSKTAQALRTDAQDAAKPVDPATLDALIAEAVAKAGPQRHRMPRERKSLTHKFSLGGHEGYITAGMYEDGTVGEIFLTDIGKEGSTLRGMMNAFATAISIALQYGVPLEKLVEKFSYMRFEPEGITSPSRCPTTSCAGSPRASSTPTPRKSSASSRPPSARANPPSMPSSPRTPPTPRYPPAS
jgi:ribonucleoside-diphosphate reductase alpha chain